MSLSPRASAWPRRTISHRWRRRAASSVASDDCCRARRLMSRGGRHRLSSISTVVTILVWLCPATASRDCRSPRRPRVQELLGPSHHVVCSVHVVLHVPVQSRGVASGSICLVSHPDVPYAASAVVASGPRTRARSLPILHGTVTDQPQSAPRCRAPHTHTGVTTRPRATAPGKPRCGATAHSTHNSNSNSNPANVRRSRALTASQASSSRARPSDARPRSQPAQALRKHSAAVDGTCQP